MSKKLVKYAPSVHHPCLLQQKYSQQKTSYPLLNDQISLCYQLTAKGHQLGERIHCSSNKIIKMFSKRFYEQKFASVVRMQIKEENGDHTRELAISSSRDQQILVVKREKVESPISGFEKQYEKEYQKSAGPREV